jgi:hypothetical protein
MLAPLGLYLLVMLITCTMILLICWAYDTGNAEAAPDLQGDGGRLDEA